MKITTIGIDLAKNIFQLHGAMKRDDMLPYFATSNRAWSAWKPVLSLSKGVRQRAPLGAQTDRARPHRQAHGAAVREAVREEQQACPELVEGNDARDAEANRSIFSGTSRSAFPLVSTMKTSLSDTPLCGLASVIASGKKHGRWKLIYGLMKPAQKAFPNPAIEFSRMN